MIPLLWQLLDTEHISCGPHRGIMCTWVRPFLHLEMWRATLIKEGFALSSALSTLEADSVTSLVEVVESGSLTFGRFVVVVVNDSLDVFNLSL